MTPHEALGARRDPPVVAEHLVRRSVRREVLFLVEAGFDQRFWSMHVRRDVVRVEHVGQGGRQAVLARIRRALADEVARVLAVVDADFDRLPPTREGRSRSPDAPHEIWTDAHDLEGTLFGTPALEKLARQLTPALPEQGPDPLEGLRERVFAHAVPMGRLRWLKARDPESCPLVFKKQGKASKKGEVTRFDDYSSCRGEHGRAEPKRIAEALCNYSNKVDQRRAGSFLEAAAGLPDAAADQVANGHDLIGFLGVELGVERSLSADDLAERLAGCAERGWLDRTGMFADIRAWETRFPGFPVLSDR